MAQVRFFAADKDFPCATRLIFGYATGNDFTARDLQSRSSQWMLGKALDGSAPVGQYKSFIGAFLAGLGAEGFEPGRNIAVEYRWAEGEYERVPALTTELLRLKPALIVAYGIVVAGFLAAGNR